MPMIETQLQHRGIVPYLCRREAEGGLGYRETSQNIVSDDLFIPSQLAEFVSEASPFAWKQLLHKHGNDEEELEKALCSELRKRMLESSNVATFLKLRPDITFFVNGIFLGYMELKSVTNGQTARQQGRNKVITDYLESVKGIADRTRQHPEAEKERRETLFIFEKDSTQPT